MRSNSLASSAFAAKPTSLFNGDMIGGVFVVVVLNTFNFNRI